MYYLEEVFNEKNSSNSVKLLSVHPFLAFILNNRNTADRCVKLEQLGYNCVSESSFKESNTWAWWTLAATNV